MTVLEFTLLINAIAHLLSAVARIITVLRRRRQRR